MNIQQSMGNPSTPPQSPRLLSGFSVVLCAVAVVFNAFATYCITSTPHS
jgi:hypothetical protein